MCVGGGGGNNAAAEEARIREQERVNNVRAAVSGINKQFAPFDDRYYNGIKDAAMNVYAPDVARQYGLAQRRTAHGFDENNNLSSSAAARTFGHLKDEMGKNMVEAADRAVGYANEQRKNVEQNRSSLINQANALADPTISFNNAAAQAAALSTPPTFSPIGSLFQGYSGLIGNGIQAERAGYGGFGTGLFNNNNRGTARVIG